MAAALLHERLRPSGWLALALAFAGVLILMLWDGTLSLNDGIFWSLGAAACISGYMFSPTVKWLWSTWNLSGSIAHTALTNS